MKKRCSKCQRSQPLSEYTKLKAGKKGRRAQCKSCDKRYRHANKKPKMPKEHEDYTINKVTVGDHFYLHFGFTDRPYHQSENKQAAKYLITPLNTTTIKTKKL
jgi:hypothetical protein